MLIKIVILFKNVYRKKKSREDYENFLELVIITFGETSSYRRKGFQQKLEKIFHKN